MKTLDDKKKKKKAKRLTEVSTKMLTKRVFKTLRNDSYLNQSTIERLSLMHDQINSIKFVGQVKLIRYTAKFEPFLFDQIF